MWLRYAGGLNAAKALNDVAEVTIIDGKTYFEINWGCLRAITDTSFNVLHDYSNIPGKHRPTPPGASVACSAV